MWRGGGHGREAVPWVGSVVGAGPTVEGWGRAGPAVEGRGPRWRGWDPRWSGWGPRWRGGAGAGPAVEGRGRGGARGGGAGPGRGPRWRGGAGAGPPGAPETPHPPPKTPLWSPRLKRAPGPDASAQGPGPVPNRRDSAAAWAPREARREGLPRGARKPVREEAHGTGLEAAGTARVTRGHCGLAEGSVGERGPRPSGEQRRWEP